MAQEPKPAWVVNADVHRAVPAGDVAGRWLHRGFAKRLEPGLGMLPTSHKTGALLKSSQVKYCPPGNMEKASSRGHEASPQSGLGVGCKLRSSAQQKASRGT